MGIREFLLVFPGVFYNPRRAFGVLGMTTHGWFFFLMVLGIPFFAASSYVRAVVEFQNLGLAHGTTVPVLFAANLTVQVISVLLGSIILARLGPRYGVFAGFGAISKISIVSFIPLNLAYLLSVFGFNVSVLAIVGLLVSLVFFAFGLRTILGFPTNRLLGFVVLAFVVFVGIGYFFLYLSRFFIFANLV